MCLVRIQLGQGVEHPLDQDASYRVSSEEHSSPRELHRPR